MARKPNGAALINNPTGLNGDQRAALHSSGYFVIQQALDPDEVAHLSAALDTLFEYYAPNRAPVSCGGATEDRSGALSNVLEKSEELLYLMDHPRTFPLVLDLLGPYITLGLTEATLKGSSKETGDLTGFIHTDGGNSLSRIWVDEKSPLCS